MTQDTKDDKAKEIPSTFSPERMFAFWTEVVKLPTIGPVYAFSKESNSYGNDLLNLGNVLAELQSHNNNYFSLVSAAFAKAAKETSEHAPSQLVSKEDYENYRRAMIEAFEKAFTDMFASPEFSSVYGKIFSTQLDFSKSLQVIAEKNFKTLNLPTRGEVDEMLKDIHDLRKSVHELKKEIEVLKNDKTRSIAT